MEGTLKHDEKYLSIKFNERREKKFYYVWLRDNCKCEKCYNKFYNQSLYNVLDIPLDIKPAKIEIANEKLNITWVDGHKTEFLLSVLQNIAYPSQTYLETVLWDNKTALTLPTKIPANFYFNDPYGLKSLIDNITKYGFGIITGVQSTMEATEKVVSHMAMIQKTYFGEMWKVYNESSCNDTSSTTVGLLPHNDNTYWSNPAGLQVFHLLHRNGEGGQTILVDGFHIANKIKNSDPEAFKVLCNSPLESHFIDNEQHFFFVESVIKLHCITKQLHQIRFNMYDRSSLSLPEEDILKFTKAYQLFAKEVCDETNQFVIQLEPGSVIFIDNWRVLHGRNEFTGRRELCGCYVSRDDYLSKVKVIYPHIQ